MNVLVFAIQGVGQDHKPIAEGRIIELLTVPRRHIFVRTKMLGVDHETATDSFDAAILDLKALVAQGVTHLRIEAEQHEAQPTNKTIREQS